MYSPNLPPGTSDEDFERNLCPNCDSEIISEMSQNEISELKLCPTCIQEYRYDNENTE
jgi:hypothetical protein